MFECKSLSVLFTCLLVVSVLSPPVTADPGGELPNSLSDDHFVVKYADGYESSAETTLEHLQTIRSELQAETPVDTELSGKITVRIHPMDEWTDGKYSLHWHNDPNRINLIAPSDWRTVDHVDEYYIEKNLAHEYANILLYEYAEGNGGDYWDRYPSWFTEGLSEYYAYHNVSDDIEANYDPGVSEFESKVKDGAGYFAVLAQDRYSGGHLLMHYVMDEYGDRAVFRMLASDASTFEDVVQSELGTSYEVFKKRWLLWAETNVGGDYAVSEASVSKAERITSLESRLERKNETIEEYRDRLDRKNETIAQLRTTVESLNRTRQRSEGDGDASAESNATGESSPSGNSSSASDGSSGIDVTELFAGVAGGGLLTLALVGGALALRE